MLDMVASGGVSTVTRQALSEMYLRVHAGMAPSMRIFLTSPASRSQDWRGAGSELHPVSLCSSQGAHLQPSPSMLTIHISAALLSCGGARTVGHQGRVCAAGCNSSSQSIFFESMPATGLMCTCALVQLPCAGHLCTCTAAMRWTEDAVLGAEHILSWSVC